jgi:hypothetical protein
MFDARHAVVLQYDGAVEKRRKKIAWETVLDPAIAPVGTDQTLFPELITSTMATFKRSRRPPPLHQPDAAKRPLGV